MVAVWGLLEKPSAPGTILAWFDDIASRGVGQPIVITELLAGPPVASPDGSVVATSSLVEQDRVPHAVRLTLTTRKKPLTPDQVDVPVRDVPAGALILPRHFFSLDGRCLILVSAVTVPVTLTSGLRPRWISYHELAYYWLDDATLEGPYNLADGPALARFNAVVTLDHVFLWSMAEPLGSGAGLVIPYHGKFPTRCGRERCHQSRSETAPGQGFSVDTIRRSSTITKDAGEPTTTDSATAR